MEIGRSLLELHLKLTVVFKHNVFPTNNIYVVVAMTTGAIATDAFLSFGVGTGPIFVDDLGCTGAETRLLDCPSSGLGRHDCSHIEDIAVSCNRTVTPCMF